MHLLAINSDAQFWVSTTLAIVGLLVSTGVAIVTFKLAMVVRKMERGEDKYEAHLSDLKCQVKADAASLHEANTKLIDERFRGISHEVANTAEHTTKALAIVQVQAERASEAVGKLSAADHQLEMKVVEKLDEKLGEVRTEHKAIYREISDLRNSVITAEEMRKLLKEIGK